MLLADVFEHFRDLSLEPHRFHLDPAHFVSSPQMAWDATLKISGAKLDLIYDKAMYMMIESGMRGGICSINTRFAQANNKYMGSLYDPTKPSNYILYLDANNLYGWAMKQGLPDRNFVWCTKEEIAHISWVDVDDNKDFGYIVECDLDYPPELHELHNEYPLAPERVDVQVEMISDTQVEIARHYARNRTGTNVKLVPHLMRKERYVAHSLVLKFLLEHGIKLTKVHRAIRFHQSHWMAPYIDLNTNLRAAATNDVDRDFCKLMNNSTYGKSCENQRKRTDIRLLTDELAASKLIDKPNCLFARIFDENLLGVEMRKIKLVVNKPSYVGFAILELSKLLMYQYVFILNDCFDYYFWLIDYGTCV